MSVFAHVRARSAVRPGLLSALLAGTVLAGTVLAGTVPASAQSVTADDLVAELQTDQVAVAPDFALQLDEGQLLSVVQSASVPVYVAAVSEATADRSGSVYDLAVELGTQLGDSDAVVLVISDEPAVDAENGNAAADRGIDASAAIAAADDGGEFTAANVTGLVREFVGQVERQAAGTVPSGTAPGGSGGSGDTGGLLVVLGLGALGFGGYALLSSRRKARGRSQQLEDLRADVESLYGRLGSDVQLLAPGNDPVAEQALADASERYTATGALLSKADSPGEFAAARRTAVEGITAARVVRERLGLDPGPDVPMPAAGGPQLTETSRVQVGEDEYEGSPSYQPGRPHYYEGGYYGGQAIPGGWYATPFWQTLLLGSLMSGGGGRRRGMGYGGGSAGASGAGASGAAASGAASAGA